MSNNDKGDNGLPTTLFGRPIVRKDNIPYALDSEQDSNGLPSTIMGFPVTFSSTEIIPLADDSIKFGTLDDYTEIVFSLDVRFIGETDEGFRIAQLYYKDGRPVERELAKAIIDWMIEQNMIDGEGNE